MTPEQQKLRRLLRIALPVLLAVLVLLTALLLIRKFRNVQQTAELPEVAHNTYRTDGFYREDGFLRYADAPHMVGVDVSAHQEDIDWEAVAAAGVEFAIIRAGYRGSTEGGLYEDAFFRANVEGAQAAGLQVGVYFFSQARNAAEAREEAEYACSLIDGYTLSLPVFYDWETVAGSERVPSPEGIPMTDCALAFCETVENCGNAAGVYFNQTYGYLYLDLDELQGYTLWLAEYNDVPTFSYSFDCLQYTDSGVVDGISVPVDLNLLIIRE